jgi:hypothetical protein
MRAGSCAHNHETDAWNIIDRLAWLQECFFVQIQSWIPPMRFEFWAFCSREKILQASGRELLTRNHFLDS